MPGSLLARVREFVSRYGARPGPSISLGQELAEQESPNEDVSKLLQGLRCMHRDTVSMANRFMKRTTARKSLTATLSQWAANMRYRGCIRHSELSRALSVSIKGNVRPRMLANSGSRVSLVRRKVAEKTQVRVKGPRAQTALMLAVGSGAAQEQHVDTTGAIAVTRRSDHPTVPLAPQFVVNWVYQALVDVYYTLEQVLGTFGGGGHFNANGTFCGEGSGEVVLFWGTHLGAVRDQAMIAWDYDGDLAVFLRHGASFASLWQLVQIPLTKLGYRCTHHSTNKYRIGPKDPMCWAPYKELYQETREKCNESRQVILKKCAKLWTAGKRSTNPHGSNCIDIEVYDDSRWRLSQKAFQIFGSQPFLMTSRNLFPTRPQAFGPLQFKIPRSTRVLEVEYGATCTTVPIVKEFTRGGVMKLQSGPPPKSLRRAAWPYTELQRVPSSYWS